MRCGDPAEEAHGERERIIQGGLGGRVKIQTTRLGRTGASRPRGGKKTVLDKERDEGSARNSDVGRRAGLLIRESDREKEIGKE